MDNHSTLREQSEQDGIEFFFAMFVDMHGKPCAKLVPASSFDMLVNDGVGFAGFAAGSMGQTPADPDMIAIPDPTSYTPVPWQPGLAILQCDIHVEGEPWPYAPRVILKNQLAKLAELDLVFNVGIEAEYFLVRRTEDGGIAVADPLDVAPVPCYDAKGLTRMYDHLTAVSTYMNRLGWANYANDHEDGNGQFEQNFEYADALTTADRTIFLRYMVHTIAHQAGMAATFMPKPFTHLTGNGLHMHTSLWSTDGEELFVRAESEDPRGLGISDMAYGYTAGLIEHGRALAGVVAPTVNSYKRLGVGPPTSGATWAPSYVTYGGNNRSQMLRIPEPGRVEIRAVDGAANPYLAFAAVVAAGLDGIGRGLDPGEPNRDNLFELSTEEIEARGIRSMPHTLAEAVSELLADDVLRVALGSVPGGDYVDYFADIKAAEFADYHRQVSGWEIGRYLTLF